MKRQALLLVPVSIFLLLLMSHVAPAHAACSCTQGGYHIDPGVTVTGADCTEVDQNAQDQAYADSSLNCDFTILCWFTFTLTDSCHYNSVIGQWQESGYTQYKCGWPPTCGSGG